MLKDKTLQRVAAKALAKGMSNLARFLLGEKATGLFPIIDHSHVFV